MIAEDEGVGVGNGILGEGLKNLERGEWGKTKARKNRKKIKKLIKDWKGAWEDKCATGKL